MRFEKLEKNLIDIIAEQQIKLGYRKEQVELYYMEDSLKNLLDMEGGIQDIYKAFEEFASSEASKLGELGISNKGNRFCIVIPPEGSEYVHGLIRSESIRGISFLRDFLTVISRHDLEIKDIVSVFTGYSNNVCVEKMEDEDFDYLIYFGDGFPDEYRYCITFEGCHAIYHRFTIDDYKDFGFKKGTVMNI